MKKNNLSSAMAICPGCGKPGVDTFDGEPQPCSRCQERRDDYNNYPHYDDSWGDHDPYYDW